MKRVRVTISFLPEDKDAMIVLRALKKAPHWRRSRELVRWAAAYLNGESLAQKKIVPALDITEDEFDDLLDAF